MKQKHLLSFNGNIIAKRFAWLRHPAIQYNFFSGNYLVSESILSGEIEHFVILFSSAN